MVAQLYASGIPGDDGDVPAEAVTVIDSDGAALLRVSWRAESPERARVVVEGDIDQDTASALRAMLLDALAHRRVVCCDLRLATFLGSAGVETLAKTHAAAEEDGRAMVLAGIGGIAERVLRLTGVLEVLAVEPQREPPVMFLPAAGASRAGFERQAAAPIRSSRSEASRLTTHEPPAAVVFRCRGSSRSWRTSRSMPSPR